MSIVRWQRIDSTTARLNITYGQKFAQIWLADLVIPDNGPDPEVFYLERLTELFAAIQADGVYWTDRPSE